MTITMTALASTLTNDNARDNQMKKKITLKHIAIILYIVVIIVVWTYNYHN